MLISNTEEIIENGHSITSGGIINLEMYKQIGGFDDYLFIDEVDADFSYKAEINGFRVLRFENVYLNHKLGKKKNCGLFNIFFLRERTLHSPFRIYFMVRNYLLIRSRYKKDLPHIFKFRDKDFLVMLKNNIFFSGHFFSSLFNALKGLYDFAFGPRK